MGTTARALARGLTWPVAPALAVAGWFVQLEGAGAALRLADVPFVVAMATCWLVGVVLTARAFHQAAGWAFLGLGTALAWSDVTDVYADYALHWRLDAPAAELAATFSDTSFVWWFVFLALALRFTAPVPEPTRVQRWLPGTTVAAGVGFQVTALLRSTPLDRPYDDVVSPWAISAVRAPMAFLAGITVAVLGLCLIASAVVLVRVWRSAEGEARQQLLWLVAGVLPLPPLVVASFVSSYAGHAEVAGLLMSGAAVAVAVGAALSVLRYRLYDVERVVTDSAAYAMASAAVIVAFGVVVVVISRTTPISPTSQLPTVLATLAGAATARTSYVWSRRAVDRRLNRERFDAVDAVRSGLSATAPDLDALLVSALHDPSARVLYPAADGGWVTSDGRAVQPRDVAVDVRRHGAVTAKIEFDEDANSRSVVEAVAAEAAAEIDNVALRAELARQLELIAESRARIASAHVQERRRIERDLHDGAQQRLLAMALQLQSARINGQTAVLHDEVGRAIVQLGATIQELRDLAGGLQPAALAGGGLVAAVVDLAARSPVTVNHDVVDQRFPPDVENAAWFVIAEATTNAVKHADVAEVTVKVTAEEGAVRVVVTDAGRGCADPRGRGLQGLADRVAALHGSLDVLENSPSGTVVEAVLPCGS